MQVTTGRGYVYSVQYHIVWCVKYRRKVLLGDIEKRLKEMIDHIAKANHFSIITMKTDEDHVHLLIDCTPQHYIPSMLKALKGNTARFLFKEFPELKSKLWKGHLWNPSYFVATVSENTQKQVGEYIESQKQRRQGRPAQSI